MANPSKWKHPPSDNPLVRQVIDRLHVSASDAEVDAAMRAALKKKFRNTPEADELVRDGIAHHAHNREMYMSVMGGGFMNNPRHSSASDRRQAAERELEQLERGGEGAPRSAAYKAAQRDYQDAVAAEMLNQQRARAARKRGKVSPNPLDDDETVMTLTYGVIPWANLGEFRDFLWEHHGDTDYPMLLRGEDARAAEGTVFEDAIDRRVEFDSDDVWTGLNQLTRKFEDGDDAAGSLAAGILNTLGVEWI